VLLQVPARVDRIGHVSDWHGLCIKVMNLPTVAYQSCIFAAETPTSHLRLKAGPGGHRDDPAVL
jgi:hypothetical protein